MQALIDPILLDPERARTQRRHKQLRKHGSRVERPDHLVLLDPHPRAVRERRRRRHALGLTGQAALTKEGRGLAHGDHRFLAARGDDRALDLPVLDIEHRIGSVALRKSALRLAGHDRAASADVAEACVWLASVLGFQRVSVCQTRQRESRNIFTAWSPYGKNRS